jgi:RimJ/RimL family protein N-acetyltransferase
MPILETSRLILRPFAETDLEPFVAYRSDPDVARYQSWTAPYSREDGLAFIAEMKDKAPGQPDDWYQFALELKARPGLIGDCAFHMLPDCQQAEIGFSLAAAAQGHGYGAEAVSRVIDYLFDEFDLHRVSATCDVDNVASARLLERVGLRREGHFVENAWFKGYWSSEYSYAVLAREWPASKQKKD